VQHLLVNPALDFWSF